nr:YjcZ family sporulation protein [Bacillus methanolicus]
MNGRCLYMSPFTLIIVLFVLLIIVGCSCTGIY